jgi:hypothetical protein
MSASATTVNSTNVRNAIGLARQRLNLVLVLVLALGTAVERAARLFRVRRP